MTWHIYLMPISAALNLWVVYTFLKETKKIALSAFEYDKNVLHLNNYLDVVTSLHAEVEALKEKIRQYDRRQRDDIHVYADIKSSIFNMEKRLSKIDKTIEEEMGVVGKNSKNIANIISYMHKIYNKLDDSDKTINLP